MAKIICMFALAGLAASAPAVRVPTALDQESVIANIMVSLQPAIDAAIERALGTSSVQTFSSEHSVGPVQFSGSEGNTNYYGSYGHKESTSSSTFESSNSVGGEAGGFPLLHGLVGQQEVTYHETGSAHQHSGNTGSQQSVSVSTSKSTNAQVQEQKLIQAVLSSLSPSVEAAVQAALANMQSVQKDYAKTLSDRQTLDSQLNENRQVKEELDLATEESKVYKLIGPALVQQDLVEAKANVEKRISYIAGELKRKEDLLKEMDAKQDESREKMQEVQLQLQKLQQAPK